MFVEAIKQIAIYCAAHKGRGLESQTFRLVNLINFYILIHLRTQRNKHRKTYLTVRET